MYVSSCPPCPQKRIARARPEKATTISPWVGSPPRQRSRRAIGEREVKSLDPSARASGGGVARVSPRAEEHTVRADAVHDIVAQQLARELRRHLVVVPVLPDPGELHHAELAAGDSCEQLVLVDEARTEILPAVEQIDLRRLSGPEAERERLAEARPGARRQIADVLEGRGLARLELEDPRPEAE